MSDKSVRARRPKGKGVLGERFGRLVAIERAPTRGGKSRWKCKCDCGAVIELTQCAIVTGNTRSCGCVKSESTAARNRAGRTKRTSDLRAYSSWTAMRARCLNSRVPEYPRYGGRGIRICPQWDSFDVFLRDMGPRPDWGTLDRIDVNGDYEPSNCRWATWLVQGRNKRSTYRIDMNGSAVTAAEFSDITGISRWVVYRRLLDGWTPAQIMEVYSHGRS